MMAFAPLSNDGTIEAIVVFVDVFITLTLSIGGIDVIP